MDLYQLAALIANIATTVGVVFAIIFGIRAQKTETRNAIAAADRANAAAALTQDSTPQLVDALREIVERSGQSTPPRSVRWSLSNFENDRYILENIGSKAAKQVRLSSHESLPIFDPPPPQDVEPSESITFVAVASLGTSDITVTVRWEDDGEQIVWRYPLPPRPPRRR